MSNAYPVTNVVKLSEQLISIPSYVDATHDESQLAMFLMDFLRDNLPSLTVEQQFIDKDSVRSNLLIRGKKPPKLFVLGHIDTVRPNDNWSTNPIIPTIKDGYLYGLGAADMKGSLAAFLSALVEKKNEINLDELMVLFYCDEEYDFAGIKRFIETQRLSAAPLELIVSLDGALALLSGCRGLVEFQAQVTGKSGHSSNPSNGRNVITSVSTAIGKLGDVVAQYSDEYLGISTVNLAYLQGGTVEYENSEVYWQREGNVIPDYAEVTVEFRSADKVLNAERAVSLFKDECEKQGLSVRSISVRHDLRPWPVSYDSDKRQLLEECYGLAGVEFSKTDRKYSGFIDVQMITEIVQTPTFVIGAGGENKHGADESVALDDLTSAMKLYEVILMRLVGK